MNAVKLVDASAAIGFACGVLGGLEIDQSRLSPRELAAIMKAKRDLEAIDLMAICEKRPETSIAEEKK